MEHGTDEILCFCCFFNRTEFGEERELFVVVNFETITVWMSTICEGVVEETT
jgi:hypothetical protein